MEPVIGWKGEFIQSLLGSFLEYLLAIISPRAELKFWSEPTRQMNPFFSVGENNEDNSEVIKIYNLTSKEENKFLPLVFCERSK